MDQKARQTAATRREQAGYTKFTPQCQRCAHFTCDSEDVKNSWGGHRRTELSNLRCSLGRFAVKKTGWCPSYQIKV